MYKVWYYKQDRLDKTDRFIELDKSIESCKDYIVSRGCNNGVFAAIEEDEQFVMSFRARPHIEINTDKSKILMEQK